MKNKPLSFALIGAGGIAQTHLQAFQQTQLARLVAVMDLRQEAAQSVSDVHRCQAFRSMDTLMDSLSGSARTFQAAIVCTPPSTHPEICMRLAEAGIHVLCEKPFAVDRQSAEAMIEAAERNRTILTMASKFRYTQDMIRARQLITSGLLGEVLMFENTFAGHVDMSRRWNSNPAISGGGVLIDNGTHSVDIIRYLLGPIQAIQVIEGKRIQNLPVEDTVRIMARTGQDVLAAVDLSWSINKQTPWYVSVYGTQGTALVGWSESKYRRESDREWTTLGSGYNKVQAFTDQLNNFCEAIQAGQDLLIGHEDAIASVDVIEAAYESLRRDDWVSIRRGAPRETSSPAQV
jgi:predicted dehydrogenase